MRDAVVPERPDIVEGVREDRVRAKVAGIEEPLGVGRHGVDGLVVIRPAHRRAGSDCYRVRVVREVADVDQRRACIARRRRRRAGRAASSSRAADERTHGHGECQCG